ncbi:hypothetical protein JCM10212_002798 [Sporobolomyces blumeae]
MRLILTGATGSAGGEVLRQALVDPRVTAVTVLSRRPLPAYLVPDPPPSKLRVTLHDSFEAYPAALLDSLKGYDACIWALGTTSNGKSEPEYERVTRTYAVEAAKAFSTLKPTGVGDDERRDAGTNAKFVFAYISGLGADQEKRGWTSTMFGRIKGQTERDLSLVPALAAYSFRPGFIVPTVVPPPAYRSTYNTPFYQGLGNLVSRASDSMAIRGDLLAKALIEVCLQGGRPGGLGEGWDAKGRTGNDGVFENREALKIARDGARSTL